MMLAETLFTLFRRAQFSWAAPEKTGFRTLLLTRSPASRVRISTPRSQTGVKGLASSRHLTAFLRSGAVRVNHDICNANAVAWWLGSVARSSLAMHTQNVEAVTGGDGGQACSASDSVI